MNKLEKNEYKQILPLLEEVPFNVLLAQAVAKQRVGGDIFVEVREKNSCCLVVHKYGMGFLIGIPESRELWLSFLGEYRHNRTLWLQAWPVDEWDDVLQTLPGIGLWVRSNLEFESLLSLPSCPQSLPRSISEDVFKGQKGSVIPRYFWNSFHDFQIYGEGFCFLSDGIVSSIAFSACTDSRYVEIGIETHENFRQKGLATYLSCCLIRKIVAEGRIPVWSCRRENEASFRLAQSLGFREVRQLPYYYL